MRAHLDLASRLASIMSRSSSVMWLALATVTNSTLLAAMPQSPWAEVYALTSSALISLYTVKALSDSLEELSRALLYVGGRRGHRISVVAAAVLISSLPGYVASALLRTFYIALLTILVSSILAISTWNRGQRSL